jgi:hypothetical protein
MARQIAVALPRRGEVLGPDTQHRLLPGCKPLRGRQADLCSTLVRQLEPPAPNDSARQEVHPGLPMKPATNWLTGLS